MSNETLITILPYWLAAVALALLLTPWNPFPHLTFTHLRWMGALMLLVAAIFWVLIQTGEISAEKINAPGGR